MTSRLEKKEESRTRILASAGRGFRRHGFGGLGIDGLAREAGVTSGAFYAHFKSKADAFREAAQAGMRDLAAGVALYRDAGGDWVSHFVDFYLGERRRCDLAESCALQSLTTEVARADQETRADYEAELQRIVTDLGAGLPGDADTAGRAGAIAVLALLSGGVSMARAVHDPAFADEIAAAVRDAVDKLRAAVTPAATAAAVAK